MGFRVSLAMVAFGLLLVAMPLPPLAALAGVLAAVAALLDACRRSGGSPSPSPRTVGLATALVATVLGGAFILEGSAPGGFFWLLGPSFLLAAPIFLSRFASDSRKR